MSTFSPLFNNCLLVESVKLYHQGTMSIFTCMWGPKLFIELQVQPHQHCTIGTKPPILKHQLPCNKGQFAFLTTCYTRLLPLCDSCTRTPRTYCNSPMSMLFPFNPHNKVLDFTLSQIIPQLCQVCTDSLNLCISCCRQKKILITACPRTY